MNSAQQTTSTKIGTDTLHTTVIEIPVKRTTVHAAISTKDGQTFGLMICNMGHAVKFLVNLDNLTAAQVDAEIAAFRANPRTR